MKRKIGLALGSGAARGFAHIGVLQVFLENGIDVDVVAGCSMGSLIGALYVTGSDMYFLDRFARSFKIMKYYDVSIEKEPGLIKGRRIEELIKILTKEKTFEQTAKPFACVAVDFNTADVVTITSGDIYKAVRASISIPGVFVPYELGGNVYVDGGVLERTPIDACRQLGADVVIAVDVEYRGEKHKSATNSLDVLKKCSDFMSWKITKDYLKTADVLITPEVFNVQPYTTRDVEKCIALGRAAATAKLDEVKRLYD